MKFVPAAIALLALGCGTSSSPSLEGRWSTGGVMSVAQMDISPDGSLVFKYAGCLEAGEIPSKGRWRDGVLALDKPVHGYLEEPFDRFHYRRVGAREYLIPEPDRETFDKAVREWDHAESDIREVGSIYALRRIPPKADLERRLMACRVEKDQEALIEDWCVHRTEPEDPGFLVRIVNSSNHAEIRRDAIHALSNLAEGDWPSRTFTPDDLKAREAARPAIVRILREHPHSEARREMAEALTDTANLTEVHAWAGEPLRRAWKLDPDERVRLQAAFGLGILKEREVVPYLLESLPRLRKKDDQADALLCLAINDATDAVDLFEKEIHAGRLGWRDEYLLVLGRLKSARSVPLIIGVVRNPKGVLDRGHAIAVLEKIGVFTPDVRGVLMEVMRTKETWVRVKAAETLAALSPGPDPEAAALTRQVAAEMDSDHWREAALEVARKLEAKVSAPR